MWCVRMTRLGRMRRGGKLSLIPVEPSPHPCRRSQVRGMDGHRHIDAETRMCRAEAVTALGLRRSRSLRALRGLSIPPVAAELFIGASTVKTHTQRLYEKLGAPTGPPRSPTMRRGLLE